MKYFLRTILLTTAYYLGICALIQRSQKHTLTILLYHGVAPTVENGIYNYRKKFITPEAFDTQIQYLKKRYTPLSLDTAVEALRNKKTLPAYPLVITFDDGYKNTLQYASPILQKYNVPATVFLVTNFIDKKIPLWVDRLEYVIGHGIKYADNTHSEKTHIDDSLRNELKHIATKDREERLQFLEQENNISLVTSDTDLYAPCTWEEIAQHSNKAISFGAHTENHPILTKLPIEEAHAEIANSLQSLQQHIASPSKVFTYPNGQPTDYNEDIVNIVREQGCIAALTTVSGTNTKDTDMYRLKRYTMDGTDSMIAFTTTLTGTLEWFRKLFKA